MFHIHRNSNIPLTEQICREFSDRIQTGLLEPGSRLPSVRDLALTLNVSLVTVVGAYRLLEQEGYAERVHGKGTFVRTVRKVHAADFPPNRNSLHDWQLSLSDYLPRATVLGFRGRSTVSHIPYKMSTASLHPRLAGFTLPTNFAQTLESAQFSFSEYGPVEGIDELRRSIALYLGECRVPTSPEDILITSGVQQAIDVVARTFIGPGDVVVVEAPTYSGAIDIFRSRGATILSVPVDGEGLRVDLLTRLCDTTPPKVVYTMPTFQNPTGVVMSPRRRAELLHLAQTYQFLILEDDSFSDCSFISTPPPPIRSLDSFGHVIYVKGFSKVFCPGCRIAAVVSTGSVRNRVIAAKSVTDLGSPMVTQILMQVCMNQANRASRLLEIQSAVQRKRDIAIATLSEFAPIGVEWTVPLGGYNLWITLPSPANTDSLFVDALQRGVSFLPGSKCYANESIHNQLRVSIAALEDEEIREGMFILCELFREATMTVSDGHIPLI